MKTALILGISGGFGGHMARALKAQGWSLRALVRRPAQLTEELEGIELIQGDAGDYPMLLEAARGVDLIVYGINAPYHQWEGTVVSMLDISARVAEQLGLLLLFPGNVYGFNPADGPDFTEQSPTRPPRRKGELRQQMEERLNRASQRGARVIIIRCGDFFGAQAPSSWMPLLIKPGKHDNTLLAAADRKLVHSWAYLPDVARAATELVLRADELPAYSCFHFGGHRISFNQLAQAMRVAGNKRVKVKPFPWWAINIRALFSPLMRSLVEMRYLWRHELNLDARKLEDFLSDRLTQTPLPEALKESGLV